jgi:GntP family gluconate:H+ symporter
MIVQDAVEPAYGTVPLLLIAAAAVGVLLLLIIKVKLHAFVALVLVSLLTAIATRIPLAEIVPTAVEGFGTTLGSVALLVGLGAMIGRLLEVSGGAQVLADTLIRRFGEQRAPLALGVAGLIFGFPIFFDAGLVVLLPIVFSVARRLGGSVLLYAMPVAGAFAVMHAFVPPHPGPVAAAQLIGADIGLVLLFGLVIGIPTWILGGYWFGTWVGRRYDLPVPDILGTDEDEAADLAAHPGLRPVSFGQVLVILLLPLVLIFGNPGGPAADPARRHAPLQVAASSLPRRGGADRQLGARPGLRDHPHHRRRRHARRRLAGQRHR